MNRIINTFNKNIHLKYRINTTFDYKNNLFLSNRLLSIFKFTSIIENQKKNDNNNISQNHKPSTFSLSIISKLNPYIKLGRYDKPIGWILLFLPCIWGLTASYPILDYNYFNRVLLFFGGSIIMRSCGCAINDLCDRNFDKQVERTKNRPIAAGQISTNQALAYIAIHFIAGLWIMLQFNIKSIQFGFGIVPLIIIYPLMKRVTYLPQLILGLCFNYGVIIGYVSIFQYENILNILPLYISGVLWTLIYDTFYAHMDKKDDIKAGIKGTAILFNRHSKNISYILYLCIFLLYAYYLEKERNKLLSKVNHYIIKDSKEYTTYQSKRIIPYGILFISILHQCRIIYKSDINKTSDCLKIFKKSSWFGLLMVISLISNNYINNEFIERL